MNKNRNRVGIGLGSVLLVLVLANTGNFTAQAQSPVAEPQFQAAEAISVADVPVPLGSASSGTVVLDALLSDNGTVERVEVRRDVPDFTKTAIQAVQSSKFSAAMLASKPIASRIPVAVCFRPPYTFPDPATFGPLNPQSEEAVQAAFQPAEVLRPAYPDYPPDTVVWGTVALQITIGETGKADDVKVLRDLPPWTDQAELAVGKWRFMAATFNGHPVPSKILLVFVINMISNEPPPLPLSGTGPN